MKENKTRKRANESGEHDNLLESEGHVGGKKNPTNIGPGITEEYD